MWVVGTIENMTRKETLSFRELPLVSPEFIHLLKGGFRRAYKQKGRGRKYPRGFIT